MRRTIALLLLALAACGRVSAPANGTDPPTPSNTAGAPGPMAPTMMPMDQNLATGAAPNEGQSGPRERFIVCPGNPRCPPSGNRPRNEPD